MRYKNTASALKIYAVAGTYTVLLSFDIAKTKLKKKFLGFDIERRDGSGKVKKLNGSKTFASLVNDESVTDPGVKYSSLVQSYFWKDYTALPGKKYTYKVRAMFGTAADFQEGLSSSIAVTTEKLNTGTHSVYFNYGVTGSQAYTKRFGNVKVDGLNEEKKRQALAFLGRELWSEGLKGFVAQAKDSSHRLYCAFYEIEYGPFLKEIAAAEGRGAAVEIVYNAQGKQGTENAHAISHAGLEAAVYPRTVVSQAHNKFMVLCKNGKPLQVWTGSTNITDAGIFGHSNTGHWVRDKSVAEKYFRYWTLLKDNPKKKDSALLSEELQADISPGDLEPGTHVFFSPRSSVGQLRNYADFIDSAKNLVCMIFPFNTDEAFSTVFMKEKEYLRLVLFEKSSEAEKLEKSDRVNFNDRDLKITAGAVLDTALERWVEEATSSRTVGAGIRYVHNKFFLLDPLGDDPYVISGSANFSRASVISNDENTIVVRGDKRVADIYLTEFNRMFEHFWPRYLRKKQKKKNVAGFGASLDEDYTWFEEYYDKDDYGYKRKVLFAKMKGAVQA